MKEHREMEVTEEGDIIETITYPERPNLKITVDVEAEAHCMNILDKYIEESKKGFCK